jgi:hypothetical protein
MIITKLLGGLGNQMFQYAAGRALAIKNGTNLAVDVLALNSYKLHQGYQFPDIFNTNFQIATRTDTWKSAGLCNINLVQNLISKIIKIEKKSGYVYEPHFNYWPGFKDVPDESYISGYWQSEKYFIDFENELRKDFTFKPSLNGINIDLSEAIKESRNSVSLHIRRGDYLSDSKASKIHGACPISYYKNSIRFMSESLNNPKYYIFSDDIDWAIENLSLEDEHIFVKHNVGQYSYVDMMLMSMCKHHIIANSTFSWWGAWLNPSKDKIVIAPQKWFGVNINHTDLIPSNWIQL